MAKLLRHQSSSMYHETKHSGCMTGLLHFFEFYHRHHIRKRLAYRKQGGGKHTEGVKITRAKQNILSNGEEHPLLEGEKNSPIDEKSRSSVKARTKFLFSKISWKKEKKRKISPIAPRLMRTVSIHYLECNDYVLPDEMTCETKTSATDLSLLKTDSSTSSEHVRTPPEGPDGSHSGKQCEACGAFSTMFCDKLHEFEDHILEKQAIFIEKLNETKDSLLKQENRDAKELESNVSLQQSKEFADISELLNANRDLDLKLLGDPTYVLANYLHVLQSSNAKAVLTRSGSFPLSGLSGRSTRKLAKYQDTLEVQDCSKLQDKQKEIEDCSQAVISVAGTRVNNAKPHHKIMGKSSSSSSLEVLLDFPDESKKKREGLINENRKEQHRITLDGILHKIPYGQKAFEDLKKEKLRDGPASNRYDIGSPSSSFTRDESVFTNHKFAQRGIQRSRSLTESLDGYARLLESSSFKESKALPKKSKHTQEDALQDRKSRKTFERIFSNPEFGSSLPTMDLLARDVAFADKPAALGTSMHKNNSVESTSGAISSDTIDRHQEQPLLINEHDMNNICEDSDDLETDGSRHTPLHEQKIGNEPEQYDMPTKPIPISVSDSYQEEAVNPVEYSAFKDSELKSGCIEFEELNSVAKPQNQLDLDGSDGMETVKTDSYKVHMPVELSDLHAVLVHVDQKDESEFNYVMAILKKSGFCSEVIHRDCYSPYLPVDSVNFGGVEGSSHDLDTEINGSDMSPDHQLLLDLINEVLLEIHENYFSHYPVVSWNNNSHIRPLPVGYHFVEEIWSKISWHLHSRKEQNPTLEDVEARDFARNDGWLNLRWETEFVGLELEDLILDDLLDEVVSQCGSLTSEHVVS